METMATLSSLTKNPGLHKPGPNRLENTNPTAFMESTNVSKLNYPGRVAKLACEIYTHAKHGVPLSYQ